MASGAVGVIYIPVPAGLIGDTLATVPYIIARAKQHGDRVFVGPNFNPHVRALIDGLHPITFGDPLRPPDDMPTYFLDLSSVWKMCMTDGWRWHMAQGYFVHANLPAPSLPMTVDMHSNLVNWSPGLVISPFSRSNNPADNNKLWPHERWAEVAERLRDKGVIKDVYVIGSKIHDNFEPYAGSGYYILADLPLPAVLGLLRSAQLVMTLDNGIGHLCHFGGVRNHVMQYPHCLPPRFAESPFARHVRARMPIDITVDDMVNAGIMTIPIG